MAMRRRAFMLSYTLLTLLLITCALAMVVFYAPIDAQMGASQKIVYLHLPAAICTFLAALVVFISGIGYLLSRNLWFDDLTSSAGMVAAALCSIVLLTGMVWARSYWGFWWTWSPHLTFSLVLWVLYVVFVVIRLFQRSPRSRAVVSAVYGIAAFLDVPLIYLSTQLMEDVHPSSIALTSPMKTTLVVSLAAMLTLAAWTIGYFTRHSTRQHAFRSPDAKQRTMARPAQSLCRPSQTPIQRAHQKGIMQ